MGQKQRYSVTASGYIKARDFRGYHGVCDPNNLDCAFHAFFRLKIHDITTSQHVKFKARQAVQIKHAKGKLVSRGNNQQVLESTRKETLPRSPAGYL